MTKPAPNTLSARLASALKVIAWLDGERQNPKLGTRWSWPPEMAAALRHAQGLAEQEGKK